jgi:hypothetical protein
MTTQPTVHPAPPAATSIHHGMPTEIGCRAGTRTPPPGSVGGR